MALCPNQLCPNTVTPGMFCNKCRTYCPHEVSTNVSIETPTTQGAGLGNIPAILAVAFGILTYVASRQNIAASLVAAVAGWRIGKTRLGKMIVALAYVAMGLLVLKFCNGLANEYR